jgi:Zn-dependent metalloprotease
VKKLSIIVFFVAATILFSLLPQSTDAGKSVFGKKTDDEIEKATQISLEILSQLSKMQGLNVSDSLVVQKVEIDELGMAHTKVRQVVNGIPVWEGEAIVHLRNNGTLSTITDALKTDFAVSTVPVLSSKEAIEAAMMMYEGSEYLTDTPTVDLWIYRSSERDHLAYRVQMQREDGTAQTAMPVIFVDAQTGEKVFSYNNLQTGTGTSLYSGNLSISTSSAASTFYMEDLTRKQGAFNMNNTGIQGVNSGTQSRYTDTDDIWNAANQQAGVDAHYGAAKTLDYYQTVHGRNGIDGNFGPGTTTSIVGAIPLFVSRVHFGINFNNAFWDPIDTNVSYGEGDGITFSPLVSLDLAGHEMTHGITQYTANLTYQSESGALNESISDVFGAMVELFARGGSPTAETWKLGEQVYTPGVPGDALRRMDNPNAVGDPDHYSLRVYPSPCTPSMTNDNCGVHTNSSISNHAYYLLAAGGTNRVSGVTVTGIGINDASKIWYRALRLYMTANTNFANARTATLNSAADFYGTNSSQYNSVAIAWCAVGVGPCTIGGCSYSINPSSVSIEPIGGSGSTTVTTTSGCNWTAISNANWISVTSGSSGLGIGTVSFTAQATTGAARTGTISIGGQTLTIQQAGFSGTPELTQLEAIDGEVNDGFGTSVAISGDTAIIGSIKYCGICSLPGSVYVYIRNSNGSWVQQAKLFPSDTDVNFGQSVAIDGNTIVVGATTLASTGVVYVFVRNGTTWTQQQKLTATDGAANDGFGRTAIKNDVIFIGSQFDDIGANIDQGSVYVFTRSGTTWTQHQKLTANDGGANHRFGSVSFDGNTAFIGAPRATINSNPVQGAVYIFTKVGVNWLQQQKLVASDGATNVAFGTSVAVEGNTAIVGKENTLNFPPVGDAIGVAYIFIKNGVNWTEQQKIKARVGTEWSGFGELVGLSGDTAIISEKMSKSAYIFTRNADTTWTQRSQLKSPVGSNSFGLGRSLGISGNYAILGTAAGSIAGRGAAYIFNKIYSAPNKPNFDFDGDNRTDISIYRQNLGQWWYLQSIDSTNRAFQFGSSTDKIVPRDYTGDGKTDIATFTPATGFWNILRSEDSTFFGFPFGTNGDIPAPADYDGDGKADAAVFRPSNSTWFISKSSGGTTIQQFGAIGDKPVVADYDGDGKADLAIYRVALGQWWFVRSSDGTNRAFQFGTPTDKPIQGDYTGDGKADLAFFRPTTGEWFILRSEDASFYGFPFGGNGDIPASGDYDGDGKFDPAVFRPSNTTWYLNRSSAGTQIIGFGANGDIPVPNAFVP